MHREEKRKSSYVLFFTLDPNEVSRTTVSPPELARNTPILDILKPTVPIRLRLFRCYVQFAGSCALHKRRTKLYMFETRKERLHTLIASSARGLQFTHHWGLSTGSMISPDLLIERLVRKGYGDRLYFAPAQWDLHRIVFCLNIKICILESLYDGHTSMEPFHALRSQVSSFIRDHLPHVSSSYLKLLSGVDIKCPIVIQYIDEIELMTNSNIIIVRVVRWGDFHSTGTEFHVDNDTICDDWDTSVYERMNSVFSMQMLSRDQSSFSG